MDTKADQKFVKAVGSLFPQSGHAPTGDYRVRKGTPGGHSADGMVIDVSMGGGAVSSIINPQSFDDGGPEWVMRYGDPESIRYAVAGLLESFDYLLSDSIDMSEATRRLRIMRAVRSDVLATPTEGATNDR